MTEATTKKPVKRNPKKPPPEPKKDAPSHAELAKDLLSLPFQAADTIGHYLKYAYPLGVGAMGAALKFQIEAVNKGDMKGAEMLLVSQAYVLDAIFNRMAQRAQCQEDGRWFELFLKLGLRAQAQCARTLETLSTIKNPPVVFAKQANVATNQQINVGNQAGPPPASQPTAIDAPSQPQLEHTHGNYLDAGTPAATIGNDSAVATVGEIYRTADT